MKNLGFLRLLIDDFFLSKRWNGGYGLLSNFPQASAFSRRVTNRQRRRYRHSQLVPKPFILFLKDIGVRFTKSDEGMRGMKVEELETILLRSDLGNRCIIRSERLESLIRHLQFKSSIERNNELRPNYKLISKYENIYKKNATGE